MARVLTVCIASVMAAVAGSAPAVADDSDYLSAVQEDVPYVYNTYGRAAVLDLGYRICKWNAQGVQDLDIVSRVQQAAPMSESAAIKVVVKAESRLGC